MSNAIERVVDIVATSTGGATGYTTGAITGLVESIQYVPSTVTAFASGVDFVITAERNGVVLWDEDDVDAAKIVSPTQPIHDQAGVARTPSTGSPLTEIGGPIHVVNDRIKFVIAGAGDGGRGQFRTVIA